VERATSAHDELRDAAPFEAFHDGSAPPVALVVLGDRAAVEARAAFARELIEAGAMRAVDPSVDVDARVALIAAPDTLFATEVVVLAASLAVRGIAVWIAGRPGAHETVLRDAGVRGFVFVGADVVETLVAMRAAAGTS
jgi:methylmalonyl-CoA mutase